MSARQRMTMRAVRERNQTTTFDSYGSPEAPVYAVPVSLPCWVWSQSRRAIVDGDKTVFIEEHRGIFPLAVDLLEDDELADIKDRLGTVTVAGRFRVETIQRKHDHVEVALERIQ